MKYKVIWEVKKVAIVEAENKQEAVEAIHTGEEGYEDEITSPPEAFDEQDLLKPIIQLMEKDNPFNIVTHIDGKEIVKDKKEIVKEVQVSDILMRFAEQYRVELWDNLTTSDIQGVAQVEAQEIYQLVTEKI